MDFANTTQDTRNLAILQRAPPPFSYQTLMILEVSIFIAATGAFATFGVFSNIINIIVFWRQGILSSSTNVNLSGLAVSDFITCFTVLMTAVSLGLVHFSENGANPSTSFTMLRFISQLPDVSLQITCLITSVTAFERVISVILPFKVKQLFTARRSLVVISNIFVAVVILNSPYLLRFTLTWKIHPVTNTSYLTYRYSQLNNPELVRLNAILVSSGLRFTSISVAVVCNVIMLWQVALSQRFRKIASASTFTSKTSVPRPSTKANTDNEKMENNRTENADSNIEINKVKPMLTKEAKLLRMITLITCVFTVCNAWEIPITVLFKYVLRVGVDFHVFAINVLFSVATFTGVVNASTNIIIYYNMSSRYKETYSEMFTRNKRK